MKNLLLAIGVASVLGLGACTTTSSSFVEDRSGVAVIKGRIVQVENLSAGNIRRFDDGIAVTVNRPGCKVSIAFSDTQTKVMELGPGAIIVYGGETDYVVRQAHGMPAK
jgi:hypothetical protein